MATLRETSAEGGERAKYQTRTPSTGEASGEEEAEMTDKELDKLESLLRGVGTMAQEYGDWQVAIQELGQKAVDELRKTQDLEEEEHPWNQYFR